MKKVAIIEDDTDQARLIAFWMQSCGFESVLYVNAELFIEAYNTGAKFDLVLIDWTLPGMDGLSLIKILSAKPNCPPSIFVTHKSKEIELAAALSAGADDFISKPLNKTVLLARVCATLRRYGKHLEIKKDKPALILNSDQPLLRYNNQQLRLSVKEYHLMKLFLQSEQGTLFNRDELLDALWGDSEKLQDSRALDLTISRLRKKLNSLKPLPGKIINHYGQGYLFEYSR